MKLFKKIVSHNQSFIIKVSYFGGDQIGIYAYNLENTITFNDSITLKLGHLPDYNKHYDIIREGIDEMQKKCEKHAKFHALHSKLINVLMNSHNFKIVPEDGIK